MIDQTHLSSAPNRSTDVPARLCVLASGSGGNLSILQIGRGEQSDYCLLDLGISPRTALPKMLAMGIKTNQIRAAFVTHLDGDHFKPSWQRSLPTGCRLYLHKSHARSGASRKLLRRAVTPFNAAESEHIEVTPDLMMRATLASHDTLGVASFRFDFHGRRTTHASLGFATDLGRVPDNVIEMHSGVDVMALESNYCPIMQRASGRPTYLKDRIMGGSGHLSNEQSREALDQIGPRTSAVLLHLSRECNSPDRAREVHSQDNPSHSIVVTSQFEPTSWIEIVGASEPAMLSQRPVAHQMPLFSFASAETSPLRDGARPPEKQ